jgi:hypothetical protein
MHFCRKRILQSHLDVILRIARPDNQIEQNNRHGHDYSPRFKISIGCCARDRACGIGPLPYAAAEVRSYMLRFHCPGSLPVIPLAGTVRC